eukprot:TRINITY_DN29435_c0_g1_i1.p1 TRINITY_DN29435_c0_g1~~TRINITY_DN29435_c0_g1_i1.p1  ORF type:complete len:117 (-),score=6.16 TRINITY_DN29435_c0_g1_i1:5-355(-)
MRLAFQQHMRGAGFRGTAGRRQPARPRADDGDLVHGGCCLAQDHAFPLLKLIGNKPGLAVGIEEELALFFERERPRSDAPEHRDLAAGLVDRPITMQAFGQRQRRHSGLVAPCTLR